MDDLAVFQNGNKLTEENLMSNRRNTNNDELGALHRFGNGIGCQGELALAHATEPVLGLRSGSLVLQGDTRAHNRAQRIVKERVQVANANFLTSQRAVGTTGFTNSATTQNGDRCAAQLFYVYQFNNLLSGRPCGHTPKNTQTQSNESPSVTFIITEEYHAQNPESEYRRAYFLITLSEFYRP